MYTPYRFEYIFYLFTAIMPLLLLEGLLLPTEDGTVEGSETFKSVNFDSYRDSGMQQFDSRDESIEMKTKNTLGHLVTEVSLKFLEFL